MPRPSSLRWLPHWQGEHVLIATHGACRISVVSDVALRVGSGLVLAPDYEHRLNRGEVSEAGLLVRASRPGTVCVRYIRPA